MSPAMKKKVFTINLQGVKSYAALHEALAAALPFPDGYGHNLDALYDVLTEYGANWKITFLHASAAFKMALLIFSRRNGTRSPSRFLKNMKGPGSLVVDMIILQLSP